ncbi:glycosyltransferase [Ruegeria arenilitoris]|uniref:glycosyltransferase n=1 Tax=Ruegeria arenilitoris TaxID=1173585 RepID=UPI00147B0356|nr:glycosyltransferase [Ruegeria arenilitoris]
MRGDFSVNHISHSTTGGGAAAAAYRLHKALLANGMSSKMTVSNEAEDDEVSTVLPRKSFRRFWQRKWSKHLNEKYAAMQLNGFSSLGYVDSGLADYLNRQPAQIVNLHWINFDMLSIAEIGALTQPVVWTFHDMWAFSGAEHTSESNGWRDGYSSSKHVGFDLNRWVWERKAKYWKRQFQIVCPSHWLANCVQQSELMQGWPVTVIPNPIDTDFWRAIDKAQSRSELSLPQDVPLVLFGAVRATDDPNKGFRHLVSAIQRVQAEVPEVQAVVFGGDRIDTGFPCPVHFLGHIDNPCVLKRAYSASDVFALPSRLEVLGYTGIEAMCCGIPVAAFRVGGLTDLIPDPRLGHLADPFDEEDLARGIISLLNSRGTDLAQRRKLELRSHIMSKFSYRVVAEQYRSVYERVWNDY